MEIILEFNENIFNKIEKNLNVLREELVTCVLRVKKPQHLVVLRMIIQFQCNIIE